MEKLKINEQIKKLLISEIEKEDYNPVQHLSNILMIFLLMK